MVKTYSKNNRQTCKIVQIKPINFYEMPVGKQLFRATIKDVKREYKFNSKKIYKEKLYFKDVQIFIKNTWVNVEYANNDVAIVIGKKLKQLKLNKGDTIQFNALVKNKSIEFTNVEGIRTFKKLPMGKSNATLPKSYKGKIELEVFQIAFKNENLWDKNYRTVSCDIETFNEKFDFGKPYNSQDDDIEYFREIRKMSFNGKHFNHLSCIKKVVKAVTVLRKAS